MIRRTVIGLIVAGLLAGIALYWLDSTGRRVLESRGELRAEQLQVAALADLAGRTIGAPDVLRSVVSRFAVGENSFRWVRVIKGRDLVASTAAEDTGDRAAPRTLEREEKPLFDQARALAAAVENNRDPGNPRKEEVLFEPLEDGGLRFAMPVEEGGEVVGMLAAERPAPEISPGGSLLGAALVIVLPALLFWAARGFIGERRILGAATAALLTAASVLVAAVVVWGGLDTVQHDAAEALAQQALRAEDLASRTLIELGVSVDPPLVPASWDLDGERRPRGMIAADGSLVDQTVDADIGDVRRTFRRGTVMIGVLAVGVALFFALGWSSRLRETLVKYREAYAYVTPAMVGMVLLVFFPFMYGIAISFTNQNIYNVDKPVWEIWIGADNYVDIITDLDIAKRTDEGLVWDYTNFYFTLGFTIVWTITNVAIGVSVGLFLALILNIKGLRFRAFYRVLLILPWAVPNYITALIWRGMFHQQFGVVNQVVQMVGGDPISWFEKPFTSYFVILATNGWLSFPFMMVICLGALQSIPSDLYEAARVDGASRWRQFTGITLPSLKPALVPAVILSVVWTFNMFNIPYLVSQGEPAGATEILITDAYKIAFEQYRYGYAAAYSTVIFVILLTYGIWQNRVTRATEGI